MSKSTKKAADQAEREKVHKRYSNRREPDVIYPARKQVDFYDADVHQRVAVYVRVSTDNLGQETSYELQKNYYEEFVLKHPNWSLVKIYADKGISGTSTKHRVALNQMLADSRAGKIDLIITKSVSRLARNTLDFLTSIRKLKALGIKVIFVNYDQTSSDSSEFMLTMLSAIAQEESANISKRVKFGKKINAEKGRVPNLIYGYDKIPGDYFNLSINETESAVVKQIFDMYTEKNMGENRIALELNRRGLKTKRNCKWSQNAVARILSNEIYIGKIVNGKETVEDFLTGKRTVMEKEKDVWSFKTSDLVTIPNIITYVRFVLIIPFVYFFLAEQYIYAAICIGLSGLSDCFDGMAARKLNQVTPLGKILDPIADKVTLFAVVICMVIYVPMVLPILVTLLVKDLLMLLGGADLIKKRLTPPSANWYGKVGTIIFYFSVCLIVFLKAFFAYENMVLDLILLSVTATSMLYALYRYGKIYFAMIKEYNESLKKTADIKNK